MCSMFKVINQRSTFPPHQKTSLKFVRKRSLNESENDGKIN